MQLSKIKVSGFKTFVDPTTVLVPSKLVAIVGPNGCGKSNIIDAVTWVMGESSPKYLRGESSTDVIFNGSSTRKPVGQASVELIFDNSDGSLGGEYAQYAEISVKRMINRASDSNYYLNNTKCRKRDVIDIFLGTGLGPRSYSIIGQNMISKIIEAKPDELRTYLEEAAGISKYKERRHETELRIGHTKENLSRVNDLRIELEKQLSHLKHQAQVAEKYKSLKEQERILKAELYAVQWRVLDSKMVDQTLVIQREETALEAKQSETTSVNRELEQLRHEQRVAQDGFQEVQRRYYAVGNEITRIEQDVLHHQEREEKWASDLKLVEEEWLDVKNQVSVSDDEQNSLEKDMFSLVPKYDVAKEEAQFLHEEVLTAEAAAESWQTRWDEFTQASANTAQTVQVEKTRMAHLEERIRFLQERQKALLAEETSIKVDELNQELFELTEKAEYAETDAENKQDELSSLREAIKQTKIAEQTAYKQLDQLRSELQRLKGEQASLSVLQETALGERDISVLPWLEKLSLNKNPRLAEHLQVEKEWQQAVEKILGANLQAVCVNDLTDISTELSELKKGNATFYSTHRDATPPKHSHNTPLLLDKITTSLNLESLLGHVYTAWSLQEAITLSKSLAAHESVITPDGIWLNRDWIKVLRDEDTAGGVLQRKESLKIIKKQIAELDASQEALLEQIENDKETLQDKNLQCDALQKSYHHAQSVFAELSAQQKVKREHLSEVTARLKRATTEKENCISQIHDVQNELQVATAAWQEAYSSLDANGDKRETYLAERDQARQTLQSLRAKWNQKNQELHEFEIRMQTGESRIQMIKQQMIRLQSQLSHLNDRKLALQSDLSSMQPIDTLKKTLSRTLDKHVSVESELNIARIAMESLEQEFKNLEEKRLTLDGYINKIKTKLEGLRLEWHTWQTKAETICEQIAETQFTLEEILKNLPPEVSINEWQAKVEQIAARINRLGPINLVAIDEYATCLERKEYLDSQVNDLESGLATLEEAIAKIDDETKEKFKETFDRVNTHFNELFPTIFGGGKAYLELNSDNLLEAGVTMMACPPGKRNSSIYLLSGGEKSLTALALIFSIFQLTPAPFCLLDEVDAALDDANVLRFTRLVKMMATKTQFIFISHNKITIEMGEYLIGVTMQEPGVSRLVSVDIEKAISMVEAS